MVAVPTPRLAPPSQSKSKKDCSPKLESMSALQAVALQKIGGAGSSRKTPKVGVRQMGDCADGARKSVDVEASDGGVLQVEAKDESSVAGIDVGIISAVSAKKRKKRGKKRKKRRKSKSTAVAGGALHPAKKGLVNPKDDCPSGEDQGLKNDGEKNMSAAEGSIAGGLGFTLATPPRSVGKQVTGSAASSTTVSAEQSTKKRKATEPVDFPGTNTCGPRKRTRVNFKEIGYAATPSPRDIPLNYNIRRRSPSKRPQLPAGAGENPPQERGADGFRIQDLAEGEAEKLNWLIEECLEGMLECESPTSGSPTGAVDYSTKNLGPFGLGQDMVQLPPLSTIPISGTLEPRSPGESQSIAQPPWDSPVKRPQRSGAALKEAIGKARVDPENGVKDISSRAHEITPILHPSYNESVPAPSAALVATGTAHSPPTTSAAQQRGPSGTDIQPIVLRSRALLSELRKRAPLAEGIIKGNHRLRWVKNSNVRDGTSRNSTRSEMAGTIYYALDLPRNNYPQITPAVDVVRPEDPTPPKPQKWSPPRGPAYEPPVSSQRRLRYISKAQQGESMREGASHEPKI